MRLHSLISSCNPTLDLFNLPQEKLKLNPFEVAAYELVSNYLDDHATQLESTWISGASTLSPEAQAAFTIVLKALTVELANIKLPGPKM